MPVIEAKGLTKIFGRKPQRGVRMLAEGTDREQLRREGLTAAVINATFDVQPGEIFVVMGLSGSGKSTLIRMINGLLEPTDGTLRIGGEDVTHLSAAGLREMRRTKVSMVFQHFALLPHRTVGENAAYALELRGVNRADRQRAGEEALALVGLKGWGGHLPSELSGGMRQRVGLARALAAGTDIMLMDEAFSALDPLIRKEMQDQLLELQSELGKTILFITHDLNEAMRLGERIAMMRDGRIVQVGSAEEILNEPANDYVSQFVADVDRTRVLTAGAVMERPVAVVGPKTGPKAAHRLMREHQTQALLVVSNDRRVRGVVYEEDIAEAVRAGVEALPLRTEGVAQVSPDDFLADLFQHAAATRAPLAVVNEAGALVGIIPRVTLLSALTPPSVDDPRGDGAEAALETTAGGAR
ncbi:glycine betaine/L-proline ABC transporter ATP-binding protein [Streptomyces sp. DSM 44915]|uniref:Glycine betaine/L-proline ABC transporter ATP-binding protein n=1 Tax=Streptomyces chisholmiae TaxID=3075540 RepID=A0ABU2JYS7_9ACTN|nr:glycine betaine/L-proline ABC transporter ATP-binding protein [Streptomyces sp. DSM 44915]MDT0269908.1 glycine betaine/L-proline ABC transporter ATP-binding protein [Streptomyces sp. DSM 44915]